LEVGMSDEQRKPGLLARRRDRKRLKRERTGDSPEKRAAHHTPKGDAVDLMLKLGGVERESSFTKYKK
jgi:hypothetical protein